VGRAARIRQLSGEISQQAAHFTAIIPIPYVPIIEKQRIFSIGTARALIIARTRWSGRSNAKGIKMFNSLHTARETATIFAGALVSALLFVSAATSFPIA
jgi:hypothetical protein